MEMEEARDVVMGEPAGCSCAQGSCGGGSSGGGGEVFAQVEHGGGGVALGRSVAFGRGVAIDRGVGLNRSVAQLAASGWALATGTRSR